MQVGVAEMVDEVEEVERAEEAVEAETAAHRTMPRFYAVSLTSITTRTVVVTMVQVTVPGQHQGTITLLRWRIILEVPMHSVNLSRNDDGRQD